MSAMKMVCWLQFRRLDDLDPLQLRLAGAPPKAVYNVNLVRPIEDGALPMQRIDEQGQKPASWRTSVEALAHRVTGVS